MDGYDKTFYDHIFDENNDFMPNFELQDDDVLSSSQENIDKFIQEQRSNNTITVSDLNILQRYMESKNIQNKQIESLLPTELNHLLSKFFMDVRKKNGKEYETDTLSSYQRSIQRYLSNKKSKVNILKDEEFSESRKVLVAKRRSLVFNHGKGNKPQAAQPLTEEYEDALFNSGEFGEENPSSLQKAMWWMLSLHFGFRARDESRKLRWGDRRLTSRLN